MGVKWYGNDGVAPGSHPQSSPSTVDGPPTTSNFPKDRVTHTHHSPKGEDDQEGQRQWRTKGREGFDKGPPLDRAIPRQGLYGDRAERFGAIGSGAGYGEDRKGKWDRAGKSTDGGFEPGNAGRTGMGKSG